MDITENIMNYISQKKTDYAIMIEGEWGCGKTYFVKNILFPEIKKKYGDEKYKLIYISLFGIHNTADISKKILLQYWTPKFNSMKSKIGGTVTEIGKVVLSNSEALLGKSFDFGEIEFTKLTNTDNIILFFDDLERATINISEVLGYINNFVEHDNIKTIIISSEKVLSDKTDGDFNLIKEKLIAKTITYKSNPEEIINNLIAEKSEDLDSPFYIINQNREQIFELLNNSPIHNYRIIRQFVNDFADIYSFYFENFEDDMGILTDILIETTLILSIEIKSNLTKKSFFEEFNSVKKFLSSIPISNDSTFAQINRRYFSNPNLSMFFMPSIYQYITSGKLDYDEAQRDRTDIVSYLSKSPTEPYEKLFDWSWFNLSDEDFESALDESYRLITSGKLPLNYYFKAYQNFKYYSENSLLSNKYTKFYQGFLSGLELVDTSQNVDSREILEQLDMNLNFIKAEDYDEQTKNIEEKIIELCSKLQLTELNSSSQLILPYLRTDMKKFEQLLLDKYETPIFNPIVISDLVVALKSLSNSQIREFITLMVKLYNMNSTIKNLEKTFINNYISHINDSSKFSTDIKVSNSLLITLKNNFLKL